ncbi:MAG: hypothetical protein ACI875_001519, partial [Planctomycetota bacterium]
RNPVILTLALHAGASRWRFTLALHAGASRRIKAQGCLQR